MACSFPASYCLPKTQTVFGDKEVIYSVGREWRSRAYALKTPSLQCGLMVRVLRGEGNEGFGKKADLGGFEGKGRRLLGISVTSFLPADGSNRTCHVTAGGSGGLVITVR